MLHLDLRQECKSSSCSHPCSPAILGQSDTQGRSLAQAVEANRLAADLANERYTRGLVDFLNVLESQRELYTSEDQLVQSERGIVVNLVALYKALGGGWEVFSQMN